MIRERVIAGDMYTLQRLDAERLRRLAFELHRRIHGAVVPAPFFDDQILSVLDDTVAAELLYGLQRNGAPVTLHGLDGLDGLAFVELVKFAIATHLEPWMPPDRAN